MQGTHRGAQTLFERQEPHRVNAQPAERQPARLARAHVQTDEARRRLGHGRLRLCGGGRRAAPSRAGSLSPTARGR